MRIRKHSIIHSQGVDDVRPLMPLFTTIPQVGSKVVGLSKSQSANPNNLTLVPEKEPFKVTTEQLNLANSSIENEMPESPPPKTNTNITGPPIGSETIAQSNKSQFKQTGSTIIPAAFAFGNDLFHRVGLGDAHVYVNNYVGTHGSGFTEPSTANKGRLIFYTGNQFVARSTDGGKTWTYNNPWSDMPRFCCDQDVIYDKNKQIFIWYRQEWPEGTGENYFRLGISKDTLNWWFYDVKPTLFSDGWKNQWWDGPQLALSNNYLFLTSNLIEGEKGSRAVLAKVSLDDLSNMRSISFVFAESPLTEGALRTVTPVQGATDTMYFGTHMSNEIMRVYQWPETESRSIPWFNIKIPSWYPTERGEMHCVGPGPDAYNSCAFADNRVLGGWIKDGKVGFIWNVAEGNGFPYPYTNAAVFQIQDMTYVERPLVWNANYGWVYGFVSPNSKGLGLVAFVVGGKYNPSVQAAIADKYVPPPPGWQMNGIVGGTNSPAQERLGDYLRIRAIGAGCGLWVGTAYVLIGGSGPTTDTVLPSDDVFPYYFILGREVDGTPEACYNRDFDG